VLFNASGPWGAALLLLFTLGVPIQLAGGGLVGLGRRVPAAAALLFPLALLALGLGGVAAGMDSGLAAIKEASDPAWVPWFALDDRARAFAPAVIGGGGAALLALPPALGAAFVRVRAGTGTPLPGVSRLRAFLRVWLLPLFGLAVAAVAATGEGVAALLNPGAHVLLVPAVGSFVFACLTTVAIAPSRRVRLSGVATGFGALAVGSVGLAVAALGYAAFGTSAALGDFSAPYAAVGDVAARTREAWIVGQVATIAALGFVLPALPALIVRDFRAIDGISGLDAMGAGALALLVGLVGGLSVARGTVFTRLAGAQAAAVLTEASTYDVPAIEPLPTRVLVGEADHPRWLVLRDRGGVDTLPVAGSLDIVGPALLRNDGIHLPLTLSLEDFYLGLFGTDAGSISIVGCAAPSPALLAEVHRDPLLATGRCSAFPLHLVVTEALEDPRVLITLKDHLLDDGGDVIDVGALADVAGRDVILRGQADATMADLVGVLHRLASARRVYLGYGVTLDGDDLPIGVNPGLRIRAQELEHPADATALAETAPAPVATAPAPAAKPAPSAAPKPKKKPAAKPKAAAAPAPAPEPVVAPAPEPAPAAPAEEPKPKKKKWFQ
jgi:hypothetical protein